MANPVAESTTLFAAWDLLGSNLRGLLGTATPVIPAAALATLGGRGASFALETIPCFAKWLADLQI